MPVDPAAPAREAPAPPPRRELEPPNVRTRLAAWIGVGAVSFVIFAVLALGVFYRLVTPGGPPLAVSAFPTPRLETTIDPRALPASLPGPVQADRPSTARPDPALIQRAMAMVAARGAQGFEPPPAPPAGGAR